MSNYSMFRGKPITHLTGALICLSIILLFPWKSQIAPSWRIQVVDEQGHPIKNLTVSQNWVNPNFQMIWLEEDFRSDENGFAILPERSAWGNVLLQLISHAWSRTLGNRQNYDAMVFGWGDYEGGAVYYVKGQELPDKLIMRR
jgi:hypothetical protein